jgi:hypothetical protein
MALPGSSDAASAGAGAAPQPASPQDPLRDQGKLLLLIIDGVGDVNIPGFGDRTPLQVAHTPNLDAIAGGSAAFSR